MTQTPESDSHRYAGARLPDRRRTCPEIVAGAVVAAAVVAVVTVGAADVVAGSAIAAAAALLGSARANIAVQQYILGAACGIGIGAGRRQETHDFVFLGAMKRRPRDVSSRDARHDAYLLLLFLLLLLVVVVVVVVVIVVVFFVLSRVNALRTVENNRLSIMFFLIGQICVNILCNMCNIYSLCVNMCNIYSL